MEKEIILFVIETKPNGEKKMANATAIIETLRAFYDVTNPKASETTHSVYFTVCPKGSLINGIIADDGSRQKARQIRLSDHFNGRGLTGNLSLRLPSAEIVNRVHKMMAS